MNNSGRPLRISPFGQGALGRVIPRNNNTNEEEVWEVNVNRLVENLKPGNEETLIEARNISWANKPMAPPSTPKNRPIRFRYPMKPSKLSRYGGTKMANMKRPRNENKSRRVTRKNRRATRKSSRNSRR